MASDSLKTPQFLGEIGQADGVMEDLVSTVVVGVRPTDDADKRQVLTVCARYRIYDAEPAHGECHHTGAHTSGPGIAVSSVPGVQLIAAADEVEARLGDKVIEKR